jgi:hypothetical protein
MDIDPEMYIKHISAVDQLMVQYRILKAREQDMAELADLIENDWLHKLDKLTDTILDQPGNEFNQFTKGLMTAYDIMRGAE